MYLLFRRRINRRQEQKEDGEYNAARTVNLMMMEVTLFLTHEHPMAFEKPEDRSVQTKGPSGRLYDGRIPAVNTLKVERIEVSCRGS